MMTRENILTPKSPPQNIKGLFLVNPHIFYLSYFLYQLLILFPQSFPLKSALDNK